MVKVSMAAALAIHALAIMSKERDKVHSTGAIAKQLGASEAHLSKVMQRLAHGGLVQMVRGARGGARVVTPAGELTLLQAIEAIDGGAATPPCALGQRGKGSCELFDALEAASSAARAELAKVTVESIGPCRGRL
jgi:Rrf2 family protein